MIRPTRSLLAALLGAGLLALLPGCVSPGPDGASADSGSTFAPAPATANPPSATAPAAPTRPTPPPAPALQTTAYLFAHFTGETPTGEQVYFALSQDGLNWRDLNDSQPVLVSTIGDKGVRDPSLIRSPDGKKFYLLATDLRIAAGRGWDAARFHGSTSLIFWESTDLVNWSAPWSVDVARDIPGAGCAWAPEAIYDEAAGAYFVCWATIAPLHGVREARVYGAHTKDFRTFTPPQLYIERAGEGLDGGDIIDTQIIEVKGAAHRYYRASRDTQITIEAADKLAGPWTRIGDLSHLGYTGRQVEGPILFQFNREPKWALLVDQYAAARGYLPLVSTNLEDPRGFRVAPASSYSLGASRKRHGGVLNITRAEYDALLARWPSIPVTRIASIANPNRFIRHYNYVPRLDTNVTPAEDGQWRLVAGLTGGANTVSIRSVNFPDRYLAFTGTGFEIQPREQGSDYANRATFIREPGLADESAVSFRLLGEGNRYLLEENGALIAGSVVSETERRNATFRLRE